MLSEGLVLHEDCKPGMGRDRKFEDRTPARAVGQTSKKGKAECRIVVGAVANDRTYISSMDVPHPACPW